MSNSGIIGDFLDMLAAETGAAANTVASYQRDLEQLSEFLGKNLEDCTEEDIKDFIHHLNVNGYAETSVLRKISALNDFFKFLLSEKEIAQNPMMNIFAPKKRKPLPKFLTRDEISLIIEAAEHNPDWRHKRTATMLKLMYACGLRVSELIKLPTNCINFDRKQILVKGKGSKERIIPVADEAIRAVLEYLQFRNNHSGCKNSPYLFPSVTSMSGYLTRDGFFKNIKKLALLAGLDSTKVSPHVLRHSFATHLLDEDVDLRSLQTMLGHEDIATTEVYTHIIPNKLINEVALKHPLAKLGIGH